MSILVTMTFSIFPIKPKSSRKNHIWPQCLAVTAAAIGSVASGLHFGWLSPAQPKLLDGEMSFPVSYVETSYIAMFEPLGYVIGCPLSAKIVDKIGRKLSILLLAGPQMVAWLMIAMAKSIEMIYLAKFIAGTAGGAVFTLLPMYNGEISQPHIRGRLGTGFTAGTVTGILLINCFGSFTTLRTSAYISLSISLLFVAVFIWMPESPYFFIMKGRIEEARESLQTLRMNCDIENELNQLIHDVQRQISEPGNYKDVFCMKSNRRAFWILIALRTFQQWGGVTVFNFYTQMIFSEATADISPALSAIIYTAIQLFSCFLGSYMIDRYGRKPLFIISSIGTTLCLLIEGTYFLIKSIGIDVTSINWLPITGLLSYVLIFGIGLGVIPNVMMGEVLSASVKAKALSLMNLYFAGCMIVTSKVFQLLELKFGMYAPFYFFAVIVVIGIIYGFFYIPETKGRTLEEILQSLKGENAQNVDVE